MKGMGDKVVNKKIKKKGDLCRNKIIKKSEKHAKIIRGQESEK